MKGNQLTQIHLENGHYNKVNGYNTMQYDMMWEINMCSKKLMGANLAFCVESENKEQNVVCQSISQAVCLCDAGHGGCKSQHQLVVYDKQDVC